MICIQDFIVIQNIPLNGKTPAIVPQNATLLVSPFRKGANSAYVISPFLMAFLRERGLLLCCRICAHSDLPVRSVVWTFIGAINQPGCLLPVIWKVNLVLWSSIVGAYRHSRIPRISTLRFVEIEDASEKEKRISLLDNANSWLRGENLCLSGC